MKRFGTWLGVLILFTGIGVSSALSQGLVVPRRHDRPPGPPLSPEEAVAKMTVPEGFTVEIVAAEPQIANPVAMFIDEKGRFWITESFEYPRKEPGPGRDRIKVLEDTDGDGKVDKVTVFAEGLNIPSGIAVGHGGVWVANAPDLLFLQDTDGDLKADKQEVIVTGFGRTDTHELPNSFTWGPDGWLYGLNGVFNYCDVKYAETNPNFRPDHPGWKFTCALWRVHPRTREFQIFCEGTSNPWGLAINNEGDFFVSACVIDHLWHLVETGYYRRQGGPYPPHTWPIESIVQHKHQKAAYCGLTWFDSDAYPEEYRKTLYMGNIHGGCINADVLERNGSTYKGKPHPGFTAKPQAWKDDEYNLIRKTGEADKPKLADLLTANDAWFMPVVQTTGPDGCLYILDWYDRYHCYQDANADPAGIDRAKGRLYRLRYKETPHAQPFDLAKETDDQLIERLGAPNVYHRWTAQRLLTERANPETLAKLDNLLFREVQPGDRAPNSPSDGDDWSRQDLPLTWRLHALWTRTSMAEPDDAFMKKLACSYREPAYRTWYYRTAGDIWRDLAPADWHKKLSSLEVWGASTPAQKLQDIIACGKRGTPELQIAKVRQADADDLFLKQIIWQNARPAIATNPELWNVLLFHEESEDVVRTDRFDELLPRSLEVLISSPDVSGKEIGETLTIILDSEALRFPTRRQSVAVVAEALRTGGLSADRTSELKRTLHDHWSEIERNIATHSKSNSETGALERQLTILRSLLGDAEARKELHSLFVDPSADRATRLDALNTLFATRDESAMKSVDSVLADSKSDRGLRTEVVALLGGIRSERVPEILLRHYDHCEADLKPRVIEVLTQRAVATRPLLAAIKAQKVSREALNLNQLRRIATFKDETVQSLLTELYGSIRDGRNPNREQVFYRLRDFLRGTPGDPFRGEAVFKKVCGQCHKIYGEGAEVGPDLTRNGRNDWDQLLWNVLDPSQVIGPGYQARILITDDGRTLTGLPVEESDQHVVLKIQGGKLETIPRSQIELYKVSEVSMMPDELEKQLTPQELADLISYLSLDKPPGDPTAKRLPGAN